MRFFDYFAIAVASTSVGNALSIPEVKDISVRDAIPDFLDMNAPADAVNDLFKRKGGGGRGSGSSSGSGGSSSGGSSSGGSSGGSSSGGGSSGSGSRPAGSGSGSSGGSSGSGGSRGTSVSPSYGGGRYYGGGATTAYSAGQRSPRGISPFLLASPLLIFPGLWLAAAYSYPYSHPYTFHNTSATNSSNPDGVNQTKPVDCLCEEYNPCGCDDNGDSTYLNSIVGNGSYAALNKSLVTVSDVNGSSTIVINGTLPNGTSSTSSGSSTGAAAGLKVLEWSGYWIMAGTVLCTVWGL